MQRRRPILNNRTETNDQPIDTSVLLDMKKELEEKQSKVNSLQGSKDTLLSQLKTEFDCDDIEQAQKLINQKQKAIEKKQQDLDTGLENLIGKYDWDFKKD